MRLPAKATVCIISALLLLATLAGCLGGVTAGQPMPYGDGARGLLLLQEYGCHSCHMIPGVAGHKAWVGPPLMAWAQRHYIAGSLANTPDNLVRWIRFPQEIEPGTAMPDLGVSEEDARHISAYLYSLQDE